MKTNLGINRIVIWKVFNQSDALEAPVIRWKIPVWISENFLWRMKQHMRQRMRWFSANFCSIWVHFGWMVPFRKFINFRERLPFDQKFRNFRNGDKWYGNILGKVPENPEIVEPPKSELFNQKFWKFQDKNQMKRKFPGEDARKFSYTSRGGPLFRNLCKFAIFYSALACSFGRDHSDHARMTRRVFDNGKTLESFHVYVDKC